MLINPKKLVDHSIFRAFNKGALGILKVEGKENKSVYLGKIRDRVYLPEGSATLSFPKSDPAPQKVAANKQQRIEMGKSVYDNNCAACHRPSANGCRYS